ncbi:MAG: TRAP transporter large permease subunit, partial [Mogibacterium sp.]|nr:TRAP transporter large permease subunit [Mogibacterium sp.]
MSALTIGLIGIVIFFLLLLTGLPIAFSMMAVGVAGMTVLRSSTAAFQTMADAFVSTFTSYTLGIVPMFVLMGEIASQTGLGTSLFDTAQKYVGHKKGGLAIAVQAVCAIFGAICGSLPATTAMMGGVAYPEM